MALKPGSAFGPYHIVSVLGAGGMGVVYRARDTRLNRDVALKILSDGFAGDVDRLHRFQREAQTLAALNHPHIAQIYGFEEGSPAGERPIHALVMELVEGEDLSERIARGAVPLDDATEIARQIAEALEAAHEAGVVHRDLKPANVKVRADGTVKVLDFGLAKALDPKASSAAAALVNSPTITSPGMTAAGMILGTAAYMSPEQARGKPVDKRADIWAFGVVLYEMLTGRVAFAGDTVTDVIAAVVTREPDWSALPHDVPAPLRQLVRRCLEKDHRLRLRDIGEARVALQSPGTFDSQAAGVAPTPSRGVPLVGAIALLAVAAGLSAWLLKPAPPGALRKLELSLPAGGRNFTLAPDAKRIAFFEHGRIWVSDLERREVRDLAPAPLLQRNIVFWSPDSAFVGFNTADGKVWVVSSTGGTALLVCTIPETRQLMGAAWGADGTIVFAVWRGSLYRVAATGGEPSVLVAIDPAKEIDFHEVVALRGGRVVTSLHLTPQPGAGVSDAFRLELIDGQQRETILGSGFWPVAYDDRGYLLLLRFDVNHGLWAVPFRGRGPLQVEEGFLVAPGAVFPMSAQRDTLLYPLESSAPQSRELVWVDRSGRVTGQIGTAQLDLSSPALSPDGQRVAFAARANDNFDIWIRDVQRGTQSRLTFEAGDEIMPRWFPGGRRVGYVESGGGVAGYRMVARNADGSGERTELGLGFGPPTISPDGRFVIFHRDERGMRVRYATVAADGTLSPAVPVFKNAPEPIVAGSSLSPDAHYLAYVERQASGLPELFVTKFPSGEGRWQISTGGGRAPVWAATGELFFIAGATDGPKQMTAVPMTLGTTLIAGTPVKLFDVPEDLNSTSQAADYDVTSDAKQLVMVRRRGTAGQSTMRWILVQNWLSEFNR